MQKSVHKENEIHKFVLSGLQQLHKISQLQRDWIAEGWICDDPQAHQQQGEPFIDKILLGPFKSCFSVRQMNELGEFCLILEDTICF